MLMLPLSVTLCLWRLCAGESLSPQGSSVDASGSVRRVGVVRVQELSRWGSSSHRDEETPQHMHENIEITASGEPVLLQEAAVVSDSIVRSSKTRKQKQVRQLLSKESQGGFHQCLQRYVVSRTKAEGAKGANKLLGLSYEDTAMTWEELKGLTDSMCDDAAAVSKDKADETEASNETEVVTMSAEACAKARKDLDAHVEAQPPGSVSEYMAEAAINIYCTSLSSRMDTAAKALMMGGPLLTGGALGAAGAAAAAGVAGAAAAGVPGAATVGAAARVAQTPGVAAAGRSARSGAQRAADAVRSRLGYTKPRFKECLKNSGHDKVKDLALSDMESTVGELQAFTDKYCEQQLIDAETKSDAANAPGAVSACRRAQRTLQMHIESQPRGEMSEADAKEAIKVFCRAHVEEMEDMEKALEKEEVDVASPVVETERSTTLESTTTPAPAVPYAVPAAKDDDMSCFPADAQVIVWQQGVAVSRALRDVSPGDLVAVGDIGTRKTWFSSLLVDLHTPSEHEQSMVPYLKIVHQTGTLHVTSKHLIATADSGFVPAHELRVGASLLVSHHDVLEPSLVLGVLPAAKTGMFAPLTWSGTVIVDGVLASNYVVAPADYIEPSALGRFVVHIGGWNNLHHLSHFFMLPMRLAHLQAYGYSLMSLHWIRPWFFPDPANIKFNKIEFAAPRYIDILARTAGSLISTVF